ncbi:polyketide cyclase [Nonomuraea cavernae]|uniref:Polyketide cyclase n=1 Tax=Nonomuraea cavernae TaxID=2045107 RepID=A0A918DRG5_9ACTN|nr:polyketide cyclase [Nonomuraea cavernae]
MAGRRPRVTVNLSRLIDARTRVRHPPEAGLDAWQAELRDLRDREAIRDLALLYTRAVDDHDIDAVVGMYTEDGVFERRGVSAAGHAAVRAAYAEAMGLYRLTLHTLDAHVVELTPGRTAVGWAAGHAELVTRKTAVMAAYRYDDAYRCAGDRWLFAHRSITFMYAVPMEEMSRGLTAPDRMRWPGAPPGRADYPESLPTWTTYRD